MGRPVVHFEIGGRDGEQLQGFYTELFDWNLTVAEDLNNYAGGGGVQRRRKSVEASCRRPRTCRPTMSPSTFR